MDVDDAAREAANELRSEHLHETRQNEQVDLVLLEPVGHRVVALAAVAEVARAEDACLDVGDASALEAARVRPVGRHAHDLDAVAAVDLVEDRLQVRALARDEDADTEAHAATAARGAFSTG